MRRAASSQNIRFSAFNFAKACSSSRLTAVCTGVASAPSTASINSDTGRSNPGASRTMTVAVLRCACAVAATACSEPSHSRTARGDGTASAKSSSKRRWLSCRDSAAEAGHVEEYVTSQPNCTLKCSSSNCASTVTGYARQPALSLTSARRFSNCE